MGVLRPIAEGDVMTQRVRLKRGVRSAMEPVVTKSMFEQECARRGFTHSTAVKNKGEWNQNTTHYANGRVVGVVMKGERPNWKQMMEDLK